MDIQKDQMIDRSTRVITTIDQNYSYDNNYEWLPRKKIKENKKRNLRFLAMEKPSSV